MLLPTVPKSICTPSRPICLATSRAAGSPRLPSDQSQAPILNPRVAGAANKGAKAEQPRVKAAVRPCGEAWRGGSAGQGKTHGESSVGCSGRNCDATDQCILPRSFNLR